jgi:tRNA threonylcarbamoyladenosine modification (KEOPS) complex  Pcc1 subunit
MPNEKVKGSAKIELVFQSPSSAKSAYDALLQETDFAHRGGSKLSISKNALTISISADDPVSLRASINSYLRLAHVIKSIEEDKE